MPSNINPKQELMMVNIMAKIPLIIPNATDKTIGANIIRAIIIIAIFNKLTDFMFTIQSSISFNKFFVFKIFI